MRSLKKNKSTCIVGRPNIINTHNDIRGIARRRYVNTQIRAYICTKDVYPVQIVALADFQSYFEAVLPYRM